MGLKQVLFKYLLKKQDVYIFLNTQILLMVVILVLSEFHTLTPATPDFIDFIEL